MKNHAKRGYTSEPEESGSPTSTINLSVDSEFIFRISIAIRKPPCMLVASGDQRASLARALGGEQRLCFDESRSIIDRPKFAARFRPHGDELCAAFLVLEAEM